MPVTLTCGSDIAGSCSSFCFLGGVSGGAGDASFDRASVGNCTSFGSSSGSWKSSNPSSLSLFSLPAFVLSRSAVATLISPNPDVAGYATTGSGAFSLVGVNSSLIRLSLSVRFSGCADT